ncbi:MAG: hypothetical protein QOE92_41 [Chloroflexota bacterium]|nr:hypothetical protein [Chloroflexota bacterium]
MPEGEAGVDAEPEETWGEPIADLRAVGLLLLGFLLAIELMYQMTSG